MGKTKKSMAATVEEPIIRDFMAIERTILANERTLLSYTRTALGLFIAGASFIQFFQGLFMQLIGCFFLPLGILTFGVGFWKYQKINDLIHEAGKAVHMEDKKEELEEHEIQK